MFPIIVPGKLQQYTIRKSKQYTINISRYFVFMLTIFTGLKCRLFNDEGLSCIIYKSRFKERNCTPRKNRGILIESIFT